MQRRLSKLRGEERSPDAGREGTEEKAVRRASRLNFRRGSKRGSVTGRRGSRKGRGDGEIIKFEGVSLLWLVHFTNLLEQGKIAPHVKLLTARTDLSRKVRKGATIKLKASGGLGRIQGVDIASGKTVNCMADQLRPKPRSLWTLEDVCHTVVLDRHHNKEEEIYINLLRSKQRHQVGEANEGAYLIAARKSPLRDVVHALIAYYQGIGESFDNQYIWIDIFCVDQRVTSHDEAFMARLHAGISSFRHRLVFLDSWVDPMALDRLWCLWEMYGAFVADSPVDHEESSNHLKLHPIYTPEEEENLVDALLRQPEILSDHIHRVDYVAQAKCLKQDLAVLQRAISHIGETKFKEVIQNVVGRWLRFASARVVDQQRFISGGQSDAFVSLLENVAALEGHHGDFKAAHELLEEAFNIKEEIHGLDSEQVAATRLRMGNLKRQEKKLDEAMNIYELALDVAKSSGGENSALVGDILNNMGNVREEMGEHNDALNLYEQALQIKKLRKGKKHRSVAIVLGNMANVYESQKKLSEALECIREAHKIEQLRSGQQSTSALKLLMNISVLYQKKGDTDKALDGFREVLAIQRRVYDRKNLRIAYTLTSIASLLKEKGKTLAGRKAVAEALEIFTNTLGPEHEDTKKAKVLNDEFLEMPEDEGEEEDTEEPEIEIEGDENGSEEIDAEEGTDGNEKLE